MLCIWQGSERVKQRVLKQFDYLVAAESCQSWAGTQKVVSPSALLTIDTWFSGIEDWLMLDANIPPWLTGLLLSSSWRLPGPEGAALIRDVLVATPLTATVPGLIKVQRELQSQLASQAAQKRPVHEYLLTNPDPGVCRDYLKLVAVLHRASPLSFGPPQKPQYCFSHK